MDTSTRQRALRIALVVFRGHLYPGLSHSLVWHSGWVWGHGNSHYLPMILGVYAV